MKMKYFHIFMFVIFVSFATNKTKYQEVVIFCWKSLQQECFSSSEDS